jgi:hypothetical protein
MKKENEKRRIGKTGRDALHCKAILTTDYNRARNVGVNLKRC